MRKITAIEKQNVFKVKQVLKCSDGSGPKNSSCKPNFKPNSISND